MSTQNRIPKVARGRDFILLYTSIQTDRTVRGLSDAAFRAYVTGLAEAGVSRTQGIIPAATKAVADMAALEGGSVAAEAAIEELLDARLLEKVDGHSMAYPNWSRFQPALKDEKARSADAQASANARWHRQGNHPNADVSNCELCERGFPSGGDPAVPAEPPGALEEPPAWMDETHTSTEPVEPVQYALVAVPDVPKPPTSQEMVADIIAALDDHIAAADLPAREYLTTLAEVSTLADQVKEAGHLKYPHGAFRNAVLAHAVRYFIGDHVTKAVINAANRGAKSLGTDGHAWYIHAASLAATGQFENDKHLIAWLSRTATNARAKSQETAA